MKEKASTESGCVVVCSGKCCKKAGVGKLRKALEKAAEEADVKVMVLKAKCFRTCSKGLAAVAWPKGVLFTEATPDDAAAILAAAGVTAKKKEKPKKEVKEKKAKVVEVAVKAKKEVKVKAEKEPKPKAVKAKKEPKPKAGKKDKVAPPKDESMTPEAHGYAE